MARRIWVVSELYYPEDAATGYFLTGIAEGLAAQKHDVHVICGQPSYWARGTRAPRSEERNGVKIHRCRATTLNKDSLLLRLVNLLSITVSMFFCALLRIRRGDGSGGNESPQFAAGDRAGNTDERRTLRDSG